MGRWADGPMGRWASGSPRAARWHASMPTRFPPELAQALIPAHLAHAVQPTPASSLPCVARVSFIRSFVRPVAPLGGRCRPSGSSRTRQRSGISRGPNPIIPEPRRTRSPRRAHWNPSGHVGARQRHRTRVQEQAGNLTLLGWVKPASRNHSRRDDAIALFKVGWLFPELAHRFRCDRSSRWGTEHAPQINYFPLFRWICRWIVQ
jgi:hypothetical protein